MKSFFNFLANFFCTSVFVCNKNLRKINFICIRIILSCSFLSKFNFRNHKFVLVTISDDVRFFDHCWGRINCDKRITTLISTMGRRSTLSAYKHHVPNGTLVPVEITITIKELLLTARAYLTCYSNVSHKASACICSSKLTFIDSK